MSMLYRHDHHSRKRRIGVVATSFLVAAVGVLSIVYFVYRDIAMNQSEPVAGNERVVSQVVSDDESVLVNEDKFQFELPNDWVEIDRVVTDRENSITWQATLKNEDNRYLTLHINTIPDDPVVRLLPVTVNGNRLQRGQLSGNCSTFSGEATDGTTRQTGPPVLAKWENVEFMCAVGRYVDENVIGTGQAGRPLNTIEVTGEESGTNRYFFVFTDRNIRPNFDILYSAVNTFTAK
jgi:hypothetical protein